MYCSVTVSGIAKFAAVFFVFCNRPECFSSRESGRFQMHQIQINSAEIFLLSVSWRGQGDARDPHLDSLNRTSCVKSGHNAQIQGTDWSC